MSALKQTDWIDRQTRAVFVEFSVYNPNINLVMVSTILIEFLSSGSILAMAKFDTLNLFGQASFGGVLALIEYLVVAIVMMFIIYFMIIEIRTLIRSGIKKYIGDFWGIIEWSIIMTAWISFAMFIVRLNAASQVLTFFKETSGFGYMKLQTANDCNQILTFSLGLCATFSTIKLLKILRFNRSISHLGQTLKMCFYELVLFSIVFFILWIAFVQLMYLTYSSHIRGYATLIKSMDTAFQVMLGKFDTSELMIANPILAPIILACYYMAVVYFSLNIFVTIIISSFEIVRAQSKLNPNEFDFYTHVAYKVKNLFKRNATLNSSSSLTNYKEHLSILPNRINGIINYMLRVTFF